MPTSDIEIQRTAHHLIQLHGAQATARAREMVEVMRRKGDNEGADTVREGRHPRFGTKLLRRSDDGAVARALLRERHGE